MMFKSASVIAVLAAVGTLSAYGAPIGYSERTSGRAIAINRDVHQTVAPIAINRDISSSEIARRIVNVTSTDEPHPPPNEKRTGPPGPPGPPGVRPQSPEHYRNMQKKGGPKGGPKGMPKDGPPPSGMDGQSPPPPDFPPPPQNVDGPPGTTPPGFCPCAPSLQPDGNSPVTTPGGDQDKPGDLPPPPPPPPVNPPIGAPSDDNESNPTDDAPNGDGSADGKGPGDVPPPESKPDGVKPPGAPSPTDACDDDAPTSTPGDSKKRRFHTRGDQVPTTGNLGKTLGKDLLELNPDDGVLAKAPEPTQRTNESRDDWKRIPPKFIRRHVPPSVLNSYWS
ncbi:hypothetical protein PC9H_009895 [Pleurotus ostreatus]|uniref:Uncharacterized protein n=1 Tax=Pleurotus ostreatus TaxID=5322 RepID=A0A8H7DQ18_PLEOS|nr:uncharacterized protein PC9H_009895 [Pleurotus ostreatus]KAF7424587.1 hypothetical protein PC9H_009895 [Pleurotus ostreatus]KAJ8692448.1 hypothetical protein PTI98_009758 [Pleurotus ostreatus]